MLSRAKKKKKTKQNAVLIARKSPEEKKGGETTSPAETRRFHAKPSERKNTIRRTPPYFARRTHKEKKRTRNRNGQRLKGLRPKRNPPPRLRTLRLYSRERVSTLDVFTSLEGPALGLCPLPFSVHQHTPSTRKKDRGFTANSPNRIQPRGKKNQKDTPPQGG